MKRKAYESDPIPSQLTHDQYKYGTRDYIMRREISQDTIDIKEFIDFVSSDNPKQNLSISCNKLVKILATILDKCLTLTIFLRDI